MTAAFFDIDGTIYRNSLLIEHFKKLIKYELLNIQMYEDRVKTVLSSGMKEPEITISISWDWQIPM